MHKYIKSVVLLLATLLISACGNFNNFNDRGLYYWGNYSDVVYDYYEQEGNYSKQEEALNQLIAASQQNNKPLAPGIYGHLGLVLLKQGRHSDAQDAFKKEQALYPESATFMQFLLKKPK